MADAITGSEEGSEEVGQQGSPESRRADLGVRGLRLVNSMPPSARAHPADATGWAPLPMETAGVDRLLWGDTPVRRVLCALP